MKVFRQVVESGGFTAAAQVLEFSVAMISKHVQHLEGHVGTRLLHRTSRKVSLTTAGSVYFERCCELLNGLDEVESLVRCTMHRPSGTLKLSAPNWFANRFFARLLHAYRQQFPEVDLQISLSDALVDLVETGLHLALRVSNTPSLHGDGRKIGLMEFVMVASREYLERHGRPNSLNDLARHEVLLYAYANYSFFGLTEMRSAWKLDNTTLIGQLAAEGAGIAVLPRLLVAQESYARELEVILPDLELPQPTLFAVTHDRRYPSIRVTSFLNFLEERMAPGACSGSPEPTLIHAR